MSRQEQIKSNSLFFNIVAILIFIGIMYFLWCLYLERKIFEGYVDHVKSQNNNVLNMPVPLNISLTSF